MDDEIRRLPYELKGRFDIMANQRPLSRVPVSKEYLKTRSQALRLSPSNFTQYLTQNTLYGVIIDMPMTPTVITTLACFVNGAANLYFSNGSDYSGAAQRYPGVVQATRVFVNNAARYVEDAEPATSFELPSGHTHYIYFLTTGGAYRMAVEATTGNQNVKERTLIQLYQRVMAELRTAQMKDRAAKQQAAE